MKVLVIPEDQHIDQYILKPIVEGIFADLGKMAQVSVLPEPRLRGATDALDKDLLARIVADNKAMTDLFLLVVDRDCDREKHAAKLEARVAESAVDGVVFFGCLAIEELECWMLALFEKEELLADWKSIREHCDPKEAFAQPLLERLGATGPGGGRKAAMRRLKGNWSRLLSRCDEIRALRDRIKTHLA